MLPSRLAARLISLIWLTSLTACANSRIGKNIEQAFAADPRLRSSPSVVTPVNTTIGLPTDFPTEIPIYPNARLQQVSPASASTNGNGKLTRWFSSEPSNFIESFYQKQFQTNNWQLNQPSLPSGSPIKAHRNNLAAIVSIQSQPTTTPSPGTNPVAVTEFTIEYVRLTESSTTSPTTSSPTVSVTPQPSQTPEPITANGGFTDLNQIPQNYSQYIKALVQLEALPLKSTGSNQNQFEPNKIISRREFAQWLFSTNNKIYQNTPAQQIRPGSQTDRPIFPDVPSSDPDFPSIQGLAEAGLIPSSLSKEDTTILFRPDAPLTREQMILQKVPLDTHHALPTASVDAVKQTWGFQDAALINPLALKAVLADFQNGDQSNIRRVFGYTTLFQPQKPVTRAEAAAALWYFGNQGEGLSAQDVLRIKTQQSQSSTTLAPTTPTTNR